MHLQNIAEALFLVHSQFIVSFCSAFFWEQEHAQEIQVLLHQMETNTGCLRSSSFNEELLKQPVLTKKIKDLEKDLYYYKKTARDLKY